MDRRTACQLTVTGLLAGVAGCASLDGDEESTDAGEGPTDDPQPDDPQPDDDPTDMTDDETDATDPTDRIDSDRVAGATFAHTEGCSNPETATVEFLDSEVEALITGCIRVHNGCAIPILVGGSEDNGTLRIEIGEADFSDPETLCTEAIENEGYELRLRFDPELPDQIEVTHDYAGGREIVATASP